MSMTCLIPPDVKRQNEGKNFEGDRSDAGEQIKSAIIKH